MREAAVSAIGQLAAFALPHSVERTEAREHLEGCLEDDWLRVRIRAAMALAALGDRSAVARLEQQADKELDGRARRAMRLAAVDIRKKTNTREEVDRLTDELSTLKRDHADLLSRVTKLEVRATKRRKKDKKHKER